MEVSKVCMLMDRRVFDIEERFDCLRDAKPSEWISLWMMNEKLVCSINHPTIYLADLSATETDHVAFILFIS